VVNYLSALTYTENFTWLGFCLGSNLSEVSSITNGHAINFFLDSAFSYMPPFGATFCFAVLDLIHLEY
jgi:hypothetical protein